MLRKEKIESPLAPGKIANHPYPFSQGWKVGGFVFTGGIAPEDHETGEIVEEDIDLQARRVFASLKAILEEAGSSLEKVIKVTVYLTDIKNKPGFEKVYREHFPKDAPGRMTAEVSFIGPGILLEMDAIAYV